MASVTLSRADDRSTELFYFQTKLEGFNS